MASVAFSLFSSLSSFNFPRSPIRPLLPCGWPRGSPYLRNTSCPYSYIASALELYAELSMHFFAFLFVLFSCSFWPFQVAASNSIHRTPLNGLKVFAQESIVPACFRLPPDTWVRSGNRCSGAVNESWTSKVCIVVYREDRYHHFRLSVEEFGLVTGRLWW